VNRREFLAVLLPAGAVPYRHYKAPNKDRACAQVMWVEEEKALQLCRAGQACWKPSATGSPYDLIVAPKPRDFNDERRLMILGHEFLHALGAEHD